MKLLILFALLLAACGGNGNGDNSSNDGNPADAVIAAFDEADLPIGSTTIFTEENDPNERLGRPGEYVAKINFHDTRLEERTNDDGQISLDSGGGIEVFDSEEDAEAWLEYVEAVNALGQTYNYQNGEIVLRLSFSLTPEQAEEYEDVLNGM